MLQTFYAQLRATLEPPPPTEDAAAAMDKIRKKLADIRRRSQSSEKTEGRERDPTDRVRDAADGQRSLTPPVLVAPPAADGAGEEGLTAGEMDLLRLVEIDAHCDVHRWSARDGDVPVCRRGAVQISSEEVIVVDPTGAVALHVPIKRIEEVCEDESSSSVHVSLDDAQSVRIIHSSAVVRSVIYKMLCVKRSSLEPVQ